MKKIIAWVTMVRGVDAMEGQFVPNITISIPVVRSLENLNPFIMDIHLMIGNPERFVRSCIEVAEAFVKVATVEDLIKSNVTRDAMRL